MDDALVFPSITICKGNSFQPDNWVLPEIILDFFKFHCKNETECHQTEKIQNDFKSVLEKIYQKLTNSVEKSYKEFHLQTWSKNFPQFNELQTLIEKNYTNIEKLEYFLEKNMFNCSDSKLEKYLLEHQNITEVSKNTSMDTELINGLTKFFIKKAGVNIFLYSAATAVE